MMGEKKNRQRVGLENAPLTVKDSGLVVLRQNQDERLGGCFCNPSYVICVRVEVPPCPLQL